MTISILSFLVGSIASACFVSFVMMRYVQNHHSTNDSISRTYHTSLLQQERNKHEAAEQAQAESIKMHLQLIADLQEKISKLENLPSKFSGISEEELQTLFFNATNKKKQTPAINFSSNIKSHMV